MKKLRPDFVKKETGLGFKITAKCPRHRITERTREALHAKTKGPQVKKQRMAGSHSCIKKSQRSQFENYWIKWRQRWKNGHSSVRYKKPWCRQQKKIDNAKKRLDIERSKDRGKHTVSATERG